jgi:hypothetical protein
MNINFVISNFVGINSALSCPVLSSRASCTTQFLYHPVIFSSDDNFASILSTVEKGRCTEFYDITHLLQHPNERPRAANSLHLLEVNLVTDGSPFTALRFNPLDLDVIHR